VTVRFGPPVTYVHAGRTLTTGRCGESGGPGRGSGPVGDLDQLELRCLTDALMQEIARLSGQEYVDRYASRAKTGGAEAAGAKAG
jgi:hypothetical protein